MKTFVFIFSICLIYQAVIAGCPAQILKNGDLPRIGRPRADEESSLDRDGCSNHILYLKKSAAGSVFSSDENGANAWMNLNNHNVGLKLAKTTIFHRDDGDAFAIYEYRFKNTRITISLLALGDYIDWVPAKIVMRTMRTTRTLRAFVTPQCDAL